MKKYIIIFTIAFLTTCQAANTPGYKKITAKQAYKLIQKNKNNKKFVILDIRTPPEYEAGHLKNAQLIDYYAPTFKEKLAKLNKNKTYLVYCRTGNRSSRSMYLFAQLGFKKIYDVTDGIVGWYAAGLPVVR